MVRKSDVALYAAKHPEKTTVLENGKLQFTETGMEFPPDANTTTLNAYAGGRAYRRAIAKAVNDAYDFSVHLPYIVPHKFRNERHFLFCTLTQKTIPRSKETVLNHVEGKRFKRRLAEAEKAKSERERIAQRRKEAKARTKENKKSRTVDVDENEDGSDVDEGQDMSDEGDVLEGILSSEDDAEMDEGSLHEEPSEIEGRAVTKPQKSCSPDENGDDQNQILHSKIDQKEIFWTRGRLEQTKIEDSSDDGDEWVQKKGERGNNPARRKSRGIAAVRSVTPATAEKDDDDLEPVASEKSGHNRGKRGRSGQSAVPKKVRRSSQRRKITRVAKTSLET